MISYCTLFDSYYLDKGIALAVSLSKYLDDNKMLYIYAFDQKAYDVLKDLKFKNVVPILFEDIISDELKEIRKVRTRAEFCWTCTPFIIEYTFQKFNTRICTYIDADLYFYSNPQSLIDEMLNKNCSAQIVEHRFPDTKAYKSIAKGSGRYCVQFNTFLNDEKGRQILSWWKEQCFACCTSDWTQGSFGDQKYLEEWQERFGNVNIMQNHGGGMAPWNIGRYRLNQKDDGKVWFEERTTRRLYELCFYHFHDLHFVSREEVDINIYLRHKKVDDLLVQKIYVPYLNEIVRIREMLTAKYQILFLDNWKKDTYIFWREREKLTFAEKVKRIIKSPVALYKRFILEKKDIYNLKGL